MCEYKYKDQNVEYVCPHPALEHSNRCIFHLDDPTKDSAEFKNELDKLMSNRSPKDLDLIGFVFPEASNPFVDNKVIKRNARLNGSRFLHDESFLASFKGDLDLSRARFEGTTGFRILVIGECSFDEAIFEKGAAFKMSEFYKLPKFSAATFKRETVFENTRFGDYTRLRAEKGRGLPCSNFENSVFEGRLRFFYVSFEGFVSFANSTFSGPASFTFTNFHEFAKFSHSQFLSSCVFERVGVGDSALLWLEDILFEHPEKTSFRYIDEDSMSRICFTDTNLSSFAFTNISWPKREREHRFSPRRILVGDECALDARGYNALCHIYAPGSLTIWETSHYGLLETVYRRLKKNYEENHDYPTAGEFHVSEMEMRRNKVGDNNQRLEYLLISLYKFLSHYGENWRVALFMTMLFAIIIPTILYMYLGFHVTSVSPGSTNGAILINYDLKWALPSTAGWIDDTLNAIMLSLKTILLQRPTDVAPASGWAKVLFLSQMVIGPVLVALTILAIKRDLHR